MKGSMVSTSCFWPLFLNTSFTVYGASNAFSFSHVFGLVVHMVSLSPCSTEEIDSYSQKKPRNSQYYDLFAYGRLVWCPGHEILHHLLLAFLIVCFNPSLSYLLYPTHSFPDPLPRSLPICQRQHFTYHIISLKYSPSFCGYRTFFRLDLHFYHPPLFY